MSDESAAAGSPPAARERTSVVFAIGFGLLLVLATSGAVVSGLFQREETFDVAELFVGGAAPAGWAAGEPQLDPGGTWIVRLERNEPEGDGPVEVTLLVPRDRRRAKRWLEGQGGDGGHGGGGGDEVDPLERWREDPSEVEPFTRVMDREATTWDVWEAPSTRVRTFQSDGTFVESVRLDLSQPPERTLVLVGRWSADVVAEYDQLRPFLHGMAMQTEPE